MGIEYYNFYSGHQESSQLFIVDCMFRPLQALDIQLTPDCARPLHLVWSPDTHKVVHEYSFYSIGGIETHVEILGPWFQHIDIGI